MANGSPWPNVIHRQRSADRLAIEFAFHDIPDHHTTTTTPKWTLFSEPQVEAQGASRFSGMTRAGL